MAGHWEDEPGQSGPEASTERVPEAGPGTSEPASSSPPEVVTWGESPAPADVPAWSSAPTWPAQTSWGTKVPDIMLPGALPPSGAPTWEAGAPAWGSGTPAAPHASDAAFAPAGSASSPAAGDGGSSPARLASHRKRLVAGGVVVSMVVALAIVAGVNIGSRAGGIHAALTSVFTQPTLQVVVSAHSDNAAEEAQLSQYSVVLSVTSENGKAPLSGADSVDSYEVSVMRGGVDVADVIDANRSVYARVDLKAIDPSAYAKAVQSMDSPGTPGGLRDLEQAFLDHQWIGIEDKTIEAFAKELGEGATAQPSTPKLDNLRNAFSLSFAQAWDVWASIHQLSSSGGTTEYALNLPVEHFVATFVADIQGAIIKALPAKDAGIARMELGAASAAVKRIPASLAIPITMWVTGGSLTRLQVSYKGNSLNLGISHPSVGVTAPQGAFMITPVLLQSFLDVPCTSVSGLGSGSGRSASPRTACAAIGSGSIESSGGGFTSISGTSSAAGELVGGPATSSYSG